MVAANPYAVNDATGEQCSDSVAELVNERRKKPEPLPGEARNAQGERDNDDRDERRRGNGERCGLRKESVDVLTLRELVANDVQGAREFIRRRRERNSQKTVGIGREDLAA